MLLLLLLEVSNPKLNLIVPFKVTKVTLNLTKKTALVMFITAGCILYNSVDVY